MVETTMSEAKQSAASYIVGFHNDVIMLTHWYANYENLLLEFEEKYADAALDKMTPEEKKALISYCQQLRYYAIKTDISYSTLMLSIKTKEDKSLASMIKTIKKQSIVKRADIEKYVKHMNRVLVDNIIKDLLDSSHDIVNQIYSKAPPTQNERTNT